MDRELTRASVRVSAAEEGIERDRSCIPISRRPKARQSDLGTLQAAPLRWSLFRLPRVRARWEKLALNLANLGNATAKPLARAANEITIRLEIRH
jgi:hypothetical protein